MAGLTIDFKAGNNGMDISKSFPTDHVHLPIYNEKIGLFWKHWRASMLIDSDVLNEEQMRWILLHIESIKSIVFETDSVGLIMQRGNLGESVPFKMVMRGR